MDEGFFGVKKPRWSGRGMDVRLVLCDMVESGDFGRDAAEKRVLMLSVRVWDWRDGLRLEEVCGGLRPYLL